MSLTPQLRAALQSDAAATTQRWSMRSLAKESSSRILLQSCVERLAQQHESLQRWIDVVRQQTARDATLQRRTLHPLDTLQYVHADTYKLGRCLLDNHTFWERLEPPDLHLANATFLELRARHATTIEKVVDVVTELRRRQSSVAGSSDHDVEAMADASQNHANVFLQRRLGIQLLCDHHVELYKGKKRNGGISVEAPLGTILTDAVLEAQHIVDVHLQIYPETLYDADTGITCTLVKPWVHHAIVELLKNCMASAVQQMQHEKASTPAPVELTLTPTNDSIVLEIVDRGTGIAGGDMGIESAFRLGHSSIEKRWDRLHEQQSYAAVRSPLASLGVGLPASRQFMEHFGGSLSLRNNTDGTGCTARIELPTNDTILERIPGEPIC